VPFLPHDPASPSFGACEGLVFMSVELVHGYPHDGCPDEAQRLRAGNTENPRGGDSVRVGCTAWAFTSPGYAAPYEDAIDAVAKLGFKGVELIVFSEQDLREYYTATRIRDLRQRYRSHGLTLSQVVVYDALAGDLASLLPDRKKRSLGFFEEAAKIAHELGTNTINMVSAWPRELTGPVPYVPHAIYLEARGQEKFNPKLSLQIGPTFDWPAIWSNFTDSIAQCAEIAQQHGLRLALEGHTHVIVSHTDSFLRLFDQVPHPALGMNFDTGWQFMQREYLPVSVRKVGAKIFHVHAKDSDGLLSYSLPAGQGIIDWDDLVESLHSVGYDGFLSFELGRYRDPARWLDRGRRYLEGVLSEHGYLS